MSRMFDFLRRKAGKRFMTGNDENNDKINDVTKDAEAIPASNRFEPLRSDDSFDNIPLTDETEGITGSNGSGSCQNGMQMNVQGDVGISPKSSDGENQDKDQKLNENAQRQGDKENQTLKIQTSRSSVANPKTNFHRQINPPVVVVDVKTTLLCFLHATGDPKVESIPIDICAGPATKPANLLDYSGLFITNLSWRVSDEKLKALLSRYGEVMKITLVRRTVAHLNAGKCVLVAFEAPEQATRALHALAWNVFDPDWVNDRFRPMGISYSSGWGQKSALTGRALEQRIHAAGECADWRIFGLCRNRLPPPPQEVSTGSLNINLKNGSPTLPVVEPGVAEWEKCTKAHLPLSRGVDRVPIRVLERGRAPGHAAGYGFDHSQQQQYPQFSSSASRLTAKAR